MRMEQKCCGLSAPQNRNISESKSEAANLLQIVRICCCGLSKDEKNIYFAAAMATDFTHANLQRIPCAFAVQVRATCGEKINKLCSLAAARCSVMTESFDLVV